MSRGWQLALVAGLVLLDLIVLGIGYRARSGTLPPWQVKDPVFHVSSSGSPSADPSAGVTGPLFLAVNRAGLVLRATRGACGQDGAAAARVSVGSIGSGADLHDVAVEGLQEALGVMVDPNGTLHVAGTGVDCEPATFVSRDRGRTWTAGDPGRPGIWALDADKTALDVTDPDGTSVQTGCPLTQIVNEVGGRALAMCGSGNFYQLEQGKDAVAIAAAGYSSLSAAPGPEADHFYVFGSTQDCTARLGTTTPDAPSVASVTCFGAKQAPLAVATAGNRIVIQLGFDVQVSSDGGKTFAALA